jgi:NDP-4-keto-2,6-dideoxyhexose 3-C-methyltransferase
MAKLISNCRICGSEELNDLFDLGYLTHAGIFNEEGVAPKDPLEIVVCSSTEGCGLVQLKHEFDPNVMYGDNYGYRSGLNQMMVDHLNSLAKSVMVYGNYSNKDDVTVLDIGSNDGTLLGHFKSLLRNSSNLFGIDPSSSKFKEYYEIDITTSNKFFSADEFLKISNGKRADIVTSIAMFYDLPEPQKIVAEISNILDDNGTWIVEQSYLPLMLGSNSFDTICHEHTEYYILSQFDWMCKKSGLKVVNMELNSSNGGSFRLYVKKEISNFVPKESVAQFRYLENLIKSDWATQFSDFIKRIQNQKNDLKRYIDLLRGDGKEICCLGASTKGNILLQYYNLTNNEISAVAEINKDKFGTKTPGTLIPIIDEHKAIEKYEYFLVLPWHFKQSFIKNPAFKGKKLIFPLPKFEVHTL